MPHGKFVLPDKPFARKSLLVNSGHLFAELFLGSAEMRRAGSLDRLEFPAPVLSP